MSLRRVATILLAAVVSVLAAALLYLTFADLGRHKGRIESLVTGAIGRPFAIDGAFELQVLPSISVVAERVRLGNAAWGSQPQMVEVGRLSLQVGAWSLISGPVDVRSLELSDVAVLLEKDAEGKGNWVFGEASPPKESAQPASSGAAAVPLVVQHAKLANLRLAFRDPGKAERLALIEALTIAPGSAGLLAIAGKGRLDEFPVAVTGEVGPLEALVSGRNIRMAMQTAVGDLKLDLNGSLGRLDPLGGADLAVKAAHPDLGSMLKKLQLPAIASGALTVDARLKEAGDLTRLDLAAKLGDITAKAEGTLRALGLPGSDLRFEITLADASRLASVFDVTGVPRGAVDVGGHLTSSRSEIRVDALTARFAGARARIDGTIGLARGQGTQLRFDVAAASLAKLREGLPAVALSLAGAYADGPGKIEVKNVKGRVGESQITARASMATRAGKTRVEVELASPLLDLTPLLARPDGGKAKPQPAVKEPPRKFVLDEAPLPFDKLKQVDAKLHLALAQVRLDAALLRDVDATLLLDAGKMTIEGRGKGGIEGSFDAALRLTPTRGGAADLDLKLVARNMRSGLGAGGEIAANEVPATSVEASVAASGGSARQMASGANGRIVVTQGSGKLAAGLVNMFGGDLLGELVGKLNPFAAQDPYTKLECTVARVDIVNGQVTVKPVLVQTEKVAIIALGEIDLGTEALKFDFNTRPRSGIGVSAGMFTNPFIELTGTLASPRLGVGAKGATAGAAAAATGGMTVLAQGLLDRVRGSQDECKPTLEEVAVRPR
jgi:uncharacterized protein involved in outer membrane biogenesis